MRIGTWNLKLCPTSTSERGQAIATWMDAQAVDVWLLTEVHRDWDPRGGRLVVAPPRGIDRKEKRWAGIETALPLGELRTAGGAEHAGDEALVLARLELGESSVLVACSVLPWRGAGDYWPGLPSGQAAQFRYVLDQHVARIQAGRLPGEPLIWGGDFNQQLGAPFWGATVGGAKALRSAIEGLDLVALTERAQHLNPEAYAIDHLAVSPELVVQPVADVHRPGWDGRQLSDHAAYTAELRMPTRSAQAPATGP
ncbi:endonuclease/exonuclease/phosphatase family protein [Geodermatophilus sp. URMC 60]